MATIESYLIPSRLYRYRRLANFDREIDAIEKGYLYCAAYKDLNDPMEGLFTSSRLLRKSENYRAIKEAVIGEKARIGICSFSGVHDHELMWAHYASQFTGICIVYSFAQLLRKLGEEASFVRMYYNEIVPTVRREHKPPGQLTKMVLSNKNYRWLYEREWRMFARRGRAYYRDPRCVTRVYLGSRMKPEDHERITRTLNQLNIKTSDMIIDEYFISFAPTQ
jgi:hypothetical protein